MNKEVFIVDGKTYAVLRPTPKQLDEAQMYYNLALREALDRKCLIRQKVEDVLREQGIWDDSKQKSLDDTREQIYELELKLKKGGIKKSEARSVAIQIKILRESVKDMLSSRNTLDSATAESHAENKRFDYLVSQCLVYNDTGEKYYKNLEEYANAPGDEVSLVGAKKLGFMIYGLSEDFEKGLPENKFLLEYGFMNDKMQLIDKKGRLVDAVGRLVDEYGRLIDENGNFIDFDGNVVDEFGNPKIEFVPFLDDEENTEELEEKTKQPRKKKTVS